MKNLSIALVSLLSVALLASCGGGGEPAGGPVTSTLSFPLQSGMRASVEQGSSVNSTVSGTCNGTASYVSNTPVPATFEGVAGVSVSNTLAMSLTNCVPSYITGTSTSYFDSNYVPIGTIVTGGSYGVYTTPAVIPASVKVGDKGTIGTETFYSDSTKTFIIGQDVVSYVIEPDTANTAIVNIIDKSYDLSGILTATDQNRYRITASGAMIPVSEDLQYSNGSTTHLVFTAVPDTAPPTVVSTDPVNYSATVTVGATLTATFSEAMDPATITAAQFTLKQGTTTVSGSVAYSGKTATFTPSAPLTPSTAYTATISSGVKDVAGNSMISNYSWSFMTVAPDLTPPTVVSTSPVDAASSVAINSTITATFSETIDSATISTATFTLMNGTTPVSGSVTYSGTTATFTPATSLANDTLYTATITPGVKDQSGNALPAAYTWNFTTDKLIIGLNFTVVDAEYSKSMDKIIMVSSVPGNQLHIYDPLTNVDTSVALNLAPTSVSVSPDGLFAAVGHNAWISYVDLSAGALVKTIPVTADVLDLVLAGNGYVYAFPRIDQWVQIHGVNIATGAETLSTGMSIYAGTKAKLHPGGTSIYGAWNGLSPSDIEKYDISAGTPVYLYNSPYHGDYSMCGDLWMSEDGLRIFTKCGNVFNATNLQSTDMVYGGALQNLSLIRHLSHSSATAKIVAIPDNSWNTTNSDNEVRVFGYDFLTFEQSIKLPNFVVGNAQYPGHGRFVFHSSSGAGYFVVLQAEAGSGMLYDYGVVTY